MTMTSNENQWSWILFAVSLLAAFGMIASFFSWFMPMTK